MWMDCHGLVGCWQVGSNQYSIQVLYRVRACQLSVVPVISGRDGNGPPFQS